MEIWRGFALIYLLLPEVLDQEVHLQMQSSTPIDCFIGFAQLVVEDVEDWRNVAL